MNDKKIFLYGILILTAFSFAFFQGTAFAAPTPATHTLHAIKVGHFDSWTAFPVASSKVNDINSLDGDTSYIVRMANSKRQTFGFQGAGLPTDGSVTIQSVSIVATSKVVGTTDNPIQLSVEKGNSAKQISDGPFFSPTKNSYSPLTRIMPTNPFTGISWTVHDLNSMKQDKDDDDSSLYFGVNNQQQQNIEVRTTEIDLQVTFLDTKAPVISGIPADITKEATDSTGSSVSYTLPTATDNMDGIIPVTCDKSSGSTFPYTANPSKATTTKVTCSATDSSGNIASASFNVKITDTTPPSINPVSVPADITQEATGPSGASVSFTSPTATDLVDPAPTVTCAPASGSTFGIPSKIKDTTTVSCTAKDSSGNISTASSFSVSVQDTTPPSINPVSVPADITQEATGPSGASVSFTSPTATDLVDPAPTVACVPASGSTFSYSPNPTKTTITPDICTVKDVAGNTATSNFNIQIQDTTSPIITVNGNDPVRLKVGSSYTDDGASAADVVDVTDPVVTSGTVDTSKEGVYVLNYDSTDKSGNTATQKSRTYDVINLQFQNTFNGQFSSGSSPIVVVTDYLATNSVDVLVQSYNTGTNPPTVRDSITVTLPQDSAGVFDNVGNPINLVDPSTVKSSSNDLYALDGDIIKATYLGSFTISAKTTAAGVALGAFPGATPPSSDPIRFYESDAYLISQYATIKINNSTIPLTTSSITAHVKSSSDTTGYDITLVRDSPSATSFTSTSAVGFSLTGTTPSINQIKTKVGDAITVTYGGSSANAQIIADPNTIITSLSAYQTNSTISSTCTGANGGDLDQDGICDNWEDQGAHSGKLIIFKQVTGKGNNYTLTCDPAATITSDPTGATVCPSKTKRDLYVELDQMQGHKLGLQAIKDVVKAFNNGNTKAITGVSSGVTLHVFQDETVPHFTSISWNSTNTSVVTVESLKQKYFGFPSERVGVKPLPTDISDNSTYVKDQLIKKRQVFHWFLSMHSQSEIPSSSGRAEKPGNDGVVSMGAFAGDVGTVDEQEGTFLHELGHNLGLDHGGLDGINCKPNYPSVENYLFQFNRTQSGGVIDRPLDFSRYTYNAITETGLNESKILGGPLGAKTINTLIGGYKFDGTPIPPPYISTTSTGAALNEGVSTVKVDLNRDGTIAKPLYAQNTHFFSGIPGCDDTSKTTLNSLSDWQNLNFIFNQQSTFRDGVVTIRVTEPSGTTFGIPAPDSVKPDVLIAPPATMDVGNLYQPDITITDSDSVSWDVVVNFGDGTPTQSAHLTSTDTNVSAIDHTFTLAGDFTITVTVTNSRTGVNAASTAIHVTPGPILSDIVSTPHPATFGMTQSFTTGITDPDLVDTYTATWIWGDGSSSPATISTSGALRSIADTHKYASTGTYHVSMNVTDDAIKVSKSTTVTVSPFVFNGFVSPIGNSQYNIPKTIPVKFTLNDVNNAKVTTAVAKIFTYKGTCVDDACSSMTLVPGTSSTQTGNTVLFSSGAYMYNLQTSNLKAGDLTIVIKLDDGKLHSVHLKLSTTDDDHDRH